jgi:T4 RnlA family RNA ligase
MNDLQQKIYDDLMNLVETHESFYSIDQVLSGYTYRIFNYRLASYSQWLMPSALECRGITFLVDESGKALALVSWPFEKFFNLHENPMSMDLDLNDPLEIQEKMDGSLISTMFALGEGSVWLKSKGSLFSEQAIAARKYLELNESLLFFVEEMVMVNDYTVIMEYTAPDNRIVVGYDEPSLTVLAIRDNVTGTYIPLDEYADSPAAEYFVRDITKEVHGVNAFVESIADVQGMEGYILKLKSGQRVKIKSEWYLKLHHIKDSINSPRRLFEAVVYDTVDDIRASFYDDANALKVIDAMAELVSSNYNHMVDVVERFYEHNKHLDRKDYAILGQKELTSTFFGLAMSKYLGREVDYRATMVKNRKSYGIKDDPVEEVSD